MFKNVAAKFIVFAFDATTNVPKTGDAANITAYVAKDYGTVTVLADTSATEMDATNAPGYYLFDAAQGETNGDCLLVSAKSATSNIKVLGAPATIYTRPTTGWLAPATAGRTLVVDAAGLADANVVKVGPTGSGTAQTAGDIYSKVGALTFTVANQVDVNVKDWAGSAVASAAAGIPKVDIDTIKTNPVVNGGTITFPTNATLASTTNITAGTITTVTTVTNQLTAAAIATGIWQDATAGDFTTASSIGKSLYTSGVVPGGTNGLFIAGTNAATVITTSLTTHFVGTVDTVTTYTGNTVQTGDAYAALVTTTYAEPSSVPAATSTLKDKISYLFTKSRNRSTQTATTQLLRNDSDAATIATVTVSDDGVTFVKGKDT